MDSRPRAARINSISSRPTCSAFEGIPAEMAAGRRNGRNPSIAVTQDEVNSVHMAKLSSHPRIWRPKRQNAARAMQAGHPIQGGISASQLQLPLPEWSRGGYEVAQLAGCHGEDAKRADACQGRACSNGVHGWLQELAAAWRG